MSSQGRESQDDIGTAAFRGTVTVQRIPKQLSNLHLDTGRLQRARRRAADCVTMAMIKSRSSLANHETRADLHARRVELNSILTEQPQRLATGSGF